MKILMMLIFVICDSQTIHLPTCSLKTCYVGDEVTLNSNVPTTCNKTAWYRYKNNSDILLCKFSGGFVTANFKERISSTCSRQSFIFLNIQLPSTGTYYVVGNNCTTSPLMSTCYNVTIEPRSTTAMTVAVNPSINITALLPQRLASQFNVTSFENETVTVHGAWGLVIVALLFLWVAIEFRLHQKVCAYFRNYVTTL
ncbi:putative membrane glycoprotein UL6 [Cynomolgus macaque cytomegalovirus strain Ottawa]|uniref:Membrane glycoprotein UL6 n=1 Tax=macacine betaherpesvirus 8 TaxID=2560567 RepID=G8H118_9BETA|nr:putative membrane glycoprotein UL6 [Cynomolgus macaque cytomegalovirus strain Ottawa]AEQ32092.1 putative membrane glycoprotein UL6 [Cynomolgus macaque cytomegalovirus strain Ottawa]